MVKKSVKLLLTALLLFAFTATAFAEDKAKDFTLKDYNGNEHSLSDFKESKAIVVMFIATRCPISNDYNERMAEIHKAYKDKDVAFIGINSNKQEDAEEVKKHAADNKLEFAILKDPNNVVADEWDAKVTPEVYVLDGDMNILYHGRIDDNRKGDNIEEHSLKNALNEILDGKEVSNPKTKAFGCTIKRV